LELVGLQPGAERPPVLVQAIDAKGAVLHSEKVGDAGAFTLPADALKNARYVVIGASQDDKTIAQAASVRFRSGEFEAALRDDTLALGRGRVVTLPLPLDLRERQRARVPAPPPLV
jgi:hypothetical protein